MNERSINDRMLKLTVTHHFHCVPVGGQFASVSRRFPWITAYILIAPGPYILSVAPPAVAVVSVPASSFPYGPNLTVSMYDDQLYWSVPVDVNRASGVFYGPVHPEPHHLHPLGLQEEACSARPNQPILVKYCICSSLLNILQYCSIFHPP